MKLTTQFPNCYITSVRPSTKKDEATRSEYTIYYIKIAFIGGEFQVTTDRSDTTNYAEMMNKSGTVLVDGSFQPVKRQFGPNQVDATAFIADNIIAFQLDK